LYGRSDATADAYFRGLAGEFGVGFVNARDWLPRRFFDGHIPDLGPADFSRR